MGLLKSRCGHEMSQLQTMHSVIYSAAFKGVAGLNFRVRNSRNRINALMKMIPKGQHLQ